MLSATVNTGLLMKAIKASNAFLSETRVKISEEGIAIRAVRWQHLPYRHLHPKRRLRIL